LPALGITSEVIATNSRKPIFGYRAMIMSILAIAFLSTIVWGHHMFARE
jgi:cytochrome c oxidase subunit 1